MVYGFSDGDYLKSLVIMQDDVSRWLQLHVCEVDANIDRLKTRRALLQTQFNGCVVIDGRYNHLPQSARTIGRFKRHDVIVGAQLDQWQRDVRTRRPISDARDVHSDVTVCLDENAYKEP